LGSKKQLRIRSADDVGGPGQSGGVVKNDFLVSQRRLTTLTGRGRGCFPSFCGLLNWTEPDTSLGNSLCVIFLVVTLVADCIGTGVWHSL